MPCTKVQNYFGQVQIVLDPSKHFWNDQNFLDLVQNMKFSNDQFFGLVQNVFDMSKIIQFGRIQNSLDLEKDMARVKGY